jgi:hypothetical protein
MSSHINGPFTFAAAGDETEIIDADDRVIAAVPFRDWQSFEEHQGIARLFSASKDLLDAAQAARLALRSSAGTEEKMNAIRDLDFAIDKAGG